MANELYYHVGYIVSNLEAAMEELTASIGVAWQTPRDRAAGDRRWRMVYSGGPLPWVELVEGQPGTPWYCPDGAQIHHLGRFVYDLDAGIREAEGAGGRIEVDGRAISGRWVYLRLPHSGGLLELVEADDERRRQVLSAV